MKFTESVLKMYAAPLSKSENDKCKHAIEAIRDALKNLGYTDDQREIGLLEYDTLAYSISMRDKYNTSKKIHIFIQGSYANNTCVRRESDVDIAVVREDEYEYAFGERFGTSTADKGKEAWMLKNAVQRALDEKFPHQVQRGNKSIKVDGNTYRKQTDTVPCLSMHYFYKSHQENYFVYHDGVIIYADNGEIIRNFPKQHIANGKAKNSRTKYYYKKMVRIIKKMRYLMANLGYESANNVSSFGIESLVWNIPDSYFTKYTCYGFAFQEILNYLFDHKNEISSYYEANGIKKLCKNQQDTAKYTAFINTLYLFFDYDYKS